MNPQTISRRHFIQSSATTAAALSAAGPVIGALGANDRIRVAFIGTGGRCGEHIRHCMTNKQVEIVAMCDVDSQRLYNAATKAGQNLKLYRDFRAVLELKDVDAVFIATPDHWHAIIAIQAIQAGKDVYMEKPIGHNIREGRAIADAAKEHQRIVQVGLQQRSQALWKNAADRVRSGDLGTITTVNCWNAWNPNEMGGDLGKPADSDPPPGVDYDLWLGPAPKRPFNPARFHFNFYFFWDYSGAMVSDWGVHLEDIVLWAMGNTIKSVSSVGGKYVIKDCRDTPDTVQSVFDCGHYAMTYSLRHANRWRLHGDMDHGIEFIGTNGVLQINRNGFQIYRDGDIAKRKPSYTERPTDDATKLHHQNFFECMRTRREPNVNAEAGHHSAIPGHLANISYRVGRMIRWDSEKETILDDPEASKLLGRDYLAPWHL